jgi:hypothetical protein
MSRNACITVFTFAALALSAHASWAQQSAEDLMRANLPDDVEPDSIRGEGVELVGPDGKWLGLTASDAVAHGGGSWTYMSAIQNFTTDAYCIRAKHAPLPSDTVSLDLSDGNYLVGAHDSLAILVAGGDDDTTFSPRYQIYSWQADESAPDGQKCSSVEPEELQDWLATPVE